MAGIKKITERRHNDTEIIEKLTFLTTRQSMIIDRLDKINGHIEDYPATKEKLDNTCLHIKVIDDEIKEIRDNMLGKKLLITIGVILGLLITIMNILQYFRIG